MQVHHLQRLSWKVTVYWVWIFATWLSIVFAHNQWHGRASVYDVLGLEWRCIVYRYRYLCQLVNEPQVHLHASAQRDELSSDICERMWWCHLVPQWPAHCSVERLSLEGQQEWYHLRITGLWGRGGIWDLFRVHLDSRLSSISWCKCQIQLKVQLSILLQSRLLSPPKVPTSFQVNRTMELMELFKLMNGYFFSCTTGSKWSFFQSIHAQKYKPYFSIQIRDRDKHIS